MRLPSVTSRRSSPGTSPSSPAPGPASAARAVAGVINDRGGVAETRRQVEDTVYLASSDTDDATGTTISIKGGLMRHMGHGV